MANKVASEQASNKQMNNFQMDKIQDVEAKIDKTINILNQLYNQLYLGYCSFILTHQIQLALVDGRIIYMQELLKTTYFACGNSAILVPRTLVEEGKRKENINIYFLFRTWEEVLNALNKKLKRQIVDNDSIEQLWQNQKIYLNVFRRRNDILNSITEHKQQLKLLEPTLRNLEQKRSDYIAHLSKKLLQKDRLVQPVYTDDLNKVYQDLFKIIKSYYDFIEEKLEITSLETLQEIVEKDFSLLMQSSSPSQKGV